MEWRQAGEVRSRRRIGDANEAKVSGGGEVPGGGAGLCKTAAVRKLREREEMEKEKGCMATRGRRFRRSTGNSGNA